MIRNVSVAGWLMLGAVLLTGRIHAQQSPFSYTLGKSPHLSADRPASNSAVDFHLDGNRLWVAGGKGLEYTSDGGASWVSFGSKEPFALESVAAIAGSGATLWTSLAGSEKTDQGSIPKGLGLAVSTDAGATWKRIAQPMEARELSTYDIPYGGNTIKALAVTTDFNNITYDIAMAGQTVWIASFAGGLRKSTDGGSSFQPVVLPPDFLDRIAPTDTVNFELSPVNRPDLGLRESLNHRVFSVHAIGNDTIWAGTAGGINLSLDGGASWRKFSFNNQSSPISGNFVVAIDHNYIGGVLHVWAATVNALNPTEFRAVSVTSDMGETWQTSLRGEFTNNFGFKGDVVYAATNSGIYRSDDGGKSWLGFSRFVDQVSRQVSAAPNCYAVTSHGDEVWVANADGLMKTRDDAQQFFGTAWTILRAADPVTAAGTVYAYPNPFAPDDEVCRIRYRSGSRGTVSMKVYDFAMFPVRTILNNAARTPDSEHDEVWDGTNDAGGRAANGVYYIQVTLDDLDPSWTKIVVLQ